MFPLKPARLCHPTLGPRRHRRAVRRPRPPAPVRPRPSVRSGTPLKPRCESATRMPRLLPDRQTDGRTTDCHPTAAAGQGIKLRSSSLLARFEGVYTRVVLMKKYTGGWSISNTNDNEGYFLKDLRQNLISVSRYPCRNYMVMFGI